LFCDSSVYKIGSQTEAFEVLRKQRYYGYGYSTTVLGYTSTVLYSFLVRQWKQNAGPPKPGVHSPMQYYYQLFIYLFYYLPQYFFYYMTKLII